MKEAPSGQSVTNDNGRDEIRSKRDDHFKIDHVSPEIGKDAPAKRKKQKGKAR